MSMIVSHNAAGSRRANRAPFWLLLRAFLTACWILACGAPTVTIAQIRYPATQYRGYGGSVEAFESFSVSPPQQRDSTRLQGSQDYRSMSPDSWENPQPGILPTTNPFQPAPSSAAEGGLRIRNLGPTVTPPKRDHSRERIPVPTQAPRNDQHFQPNSTPNQSPATGQFRPISHPLNAASRELPGDANQIDEMLPVSPAVPEDIRLPDLLPPSVFSIQGNSVVETGPALPHSQVPPGLPQDHPPSAAVQPQPAATIHQGYPFDPNDLQLDPSRMAPSNSNPIPNQDQFHFPHAQGLTQSAPHQSMPATGSAPPRKRRPELTPSIAEPMATAPPPASPNRQTQDQYYQPQQAFGYPNDVPVPAGTAWPLTAPDYRPDLGHRQPSALSRASDDNDYGQEFDFEKKHTEYPKLGEIFSTGRYFGSATVQYLRPAFQANTSLFLNQSGATETFDFAYKLAPKFQLGFESKFGPGVELEYWGYSDFSRVSSFTSDGVESGTTSAWMRGANVWSRLSAVNAGETLTARHRMELDILGASFFKEVKLPKARVNGKFGFQTAHIIHELVAELTDGSGSAIGSLRSRSDLRGFGPQFELEYFRPIGHTKIEFLTSASGSVLFGKQTQVIVNSTGGNQSRLKADEFVMTVDFFSGAQYRLMFGENRYWFARAGMGYQAWLHGGTAVLPQDSFGLRGFTITAGVNR